MYTATITKTNFSDGNLQVEVSFTNGTETLLKAFNVSSQADLDSKIKNEVSRLDNLEQTAATIAVGEYTPPATTSEPTPEPTPEPIPEPTPDEIAEQEAMLKRMQFLDKLKEWDAKRVAGKFVAAYGGTVPDADAIEFQELTQWLLANMKAEYAVEAKPYLSNLL